MRLIETQDTLTCMVCGAETHWFKWSIMGQIKLGLCEEHREWEPFFSFGPQAFENASMGVMPPRRDREAWLAEIGSAQKGEDSERPIGD